MWSKSRPCEESERTGSIHRFITRIECNLNDHDFGLCGLEPQMTREEEVHFCVYRCSPFTLCYMQCEKVTFLGKRSHNGQKKARKEGRKRKKKMWISSKFVSNGHRGNRKELRFLLSFTYSSFLLRLLYFSSSPLFHHPSLKVQSLPPLFKDRVGQNEDSCLSRMKQRRERPPLVACGVPFSFRTSSRGIWISHSTKTETNFTSFLNLPFPFKIHSWQAS